MAIPAAAAAAAGTPRQRLRANDSAPTTPRLRLQPHTSSPTPRLRLQPHTSSPINDIPAAGGCCSRNSAPTNSAPTTPRQRTPRQRLRANELRAFGCSPTPRQRLRANDSAPTTPRQRLRANDSAPTTPRQSLPHRWGKARRNSAPGWPYQQPHTSSRRLLQPELRANELRANELRAGMAIPAARLRAFGCSPIPAAQLMIYQQPAAAAAGTPRQRLRAFGCSPIPAAAAAAAGTPRQRLRANRCPTGGARRAGTPRRDGHISSPIPAAGGCCSRNSAPTNSAPGWPYQQPDSAPSAAAPYQQPDSAPTTPRLRPAARLRANDSAPTTPRQRTPRLRLQPHTSSPINDIPAAGGCCSRNSAPTNSAPSAAAPYQQPDSAPSAAAGTPRQRLRANRCPTGGARRAGTPRQRLRANDSAPTTPRQRTPRLRLQPELRANELRAGMAIPAAGGCCSRNSAPTTPRQRTPRRDGHTSSPTPRLRLQPHTSSPTPRQRLRANELRASAAAPYQQPN